MTAPIIQHTKWPHLLRELQSIEELKPLRTLKQDYQKMALWPAVSIASWIANNKPELSKKEKLHLVIAGVQNTDVTDDGMWYGVIPSLLGNQSMSIQVDLVGPEYGETPDEFKHLSSSFIVRTTLNGKLPNHSKVHKKTLGEYLSGIEVEEIDLVVLFHPGFDETYESWFGDTALSDLINKSVPVVVGSHHIDEYATDRIYAEAFGFQGASEPYANPFTFNSGAECSWFAHTLWELATAAKSPPKLYDQAMLNRGLALVTYFYEAFQRNILNPFEFILERCVLADESSKSTIIRLPCLFWLNKERGTLHVEDITEEEGVLIECHDMKIDTNDINTCPEYTDSLYNKAIWVSDMMLKYRLTFDKAEQYISDANRSYFSPTSIRQLLGEHIPEEYFEALNDKSELNKLFSGFVDFLETMDADEPGGEINREEIIEQLTDMMYTPPKFEVSPLHKTLIEALHLGDFETVCKYIEEKPELVDAQDEDGITPLYAACVMNRPDVVEKLLRLGANPNHTDREGWPLITEVVRHKAIDALKKLVSCGTLEINKTNKLGWSALLLACTTANTKSIKVLIEAGADLDQQNMAGMSARDFLEEA